MKITGPLLINKVDIFNHNNLLHEDEIFFSIDIEVRRICTNQEERPRPHIETEV